MVSNYIAFLTTNTGLKTVGQQIAFLWNNCELKCSSFDILDDSSEGNEARRRRSLGKRSTGDETDGRNSGRASLRIGGGKKSRAASLTTRRGTLKKRDRSYEKELKAEAALERKTVYLPE